MGTTTFSGPVKSGTIREGSSKNTGTLLAAQAATVGFGDTTAKTLFVLPASSQIVDVKVAVTTAFNDSTTNTIDIGTSTTSGLYVDNAGVATAQLYALGTTAKVDEWTDIGTSDVTVTGLFNGGDASEGEAVVTVLYSQGADLS